LFSCLNTERCTIKTRYYETPNSSGMKYCENKYDTLVTSTKIENKLTWEFFEVSNMRFFNLPATGSLYLAQHVMCLSTEYTC